MDRSYSLNRNINPADGRCLIQQQEQAKVLDKKKIATYTRQISNPICCSPCYTRAEAKSHNGFSYYRKTDIRLQQSRVLTIYWDLIN